MTRIAITGYGAITPIGQTALSTWDAMVEGVSGVSRIEEPWAEDLPSQIAGRVDDSFLDTLSVREQKRFSRVEQLAVLSAREAWKMAGMPGVEGERLGVVVGTGIGGITTTLEQEHVLADAGHRRVSPHTITMLMGNGPAAWISIEIGAQAGARSTVSACASGSEAISTGREMILAGNADVVLVGGAEAAITGLTMASFAQIRALSKRNSTPMSASRPFDTDRDGFVLGEGAAMLVLEREAFARARQATILGYLEGSAVTSDAEDIVSANTQRQTRTISLALNAASVSPQDVDVLYAHATSTPAGDLHESEAILATGINAPVTSTKSMTGHLLGASGPLSTVAALLSMSDGIIPPTTNIDQLDPQIDVDVVQNVKRTMTGRIAVVNAFGFGGHNAALVLTKD